jgi:hypothetical protein
MLLYANMAIDAIQSSKTSWINQFIQDKSVKEPLQQFVDAQTAFTKQIAKTYWDVTGAAAETAVSKLFQAK